MKNVKQFFGYKYEKSFKKYSIGEDSAMSMDSRVFKDLPCIIEETQERASASSKEIEDLEQENMEQLEDRIAKDVYGMDEGS